MLPLQSLKQRKENIRVSNWRERANEELRRQEEQAEAVRSAAAAQAAEQARVKAADLQRIEQEASKRFDSLGVVRKLQDINRDLWKNIGIVNVNDSSGRSRSARLIIDIPTNIQPKLEPIKERRYGRYTTSHTYGAGGPEDYHEESYTTKHFGFHNEVVGHRIVGHTSSPFEQISLSVGLYIAEDEKGSDTISIRDSHPAAFDSSEIPIDPSLKLVKATRGGEITIFSPHDGFNSSTINSILDFLLLKSSAAKVRNIDRWIEEKRAADAQIRGIQARIGQKVP